MEGWGGKDMLGFKIAGKAYCVVEELRKLTEQNKGKTLKEVLLQRKIEAAEAKQFGIPVDEFREFLHGKKEG